MKKLQTPLKSAFVKTAIALVVTLTSCSTNNSVSFAEKQLEFNSDQSSVLINYPFASSKNGALADSINQAVNEHIFAPRLVDSDEDTPQDLNFEAIVNQAKEIPGYTCETSWGGYSNSNYISLSFSNYTFQGGAHGSSTIQGLLIDAQNGKRINIRDCIADTVQFRRLVVDRYLQQNDLDPNSSGDELGYFGALSELPIPATMILTDKGLVGYYGQYEVAAYVVGITSVLIPYNDLGDHLQLDLSQGLQRIAGGQDQSK